MNLSEHFTVEELQCKGCTGGCSFSQNGKPLCNVSKKALAKLEAMREILGKPLVVYSACRCPIHNTKVGGAPMSQHRATDQVQSTAFDLALVSDKKEMIAAAERAGFRGIGENYKTFLHVDDRPTRLIQRW